MNTFTAAQVLAEADRHGDHVADMLCEYAAHLAAQAEWPSEEDVSKALSEWYEWNGEDPSDDAQHAVAMRAALQSVRPPVGFVLEEEVTDRVAKAIADASGHGMREKCEHLAHAAISAYRLSTWPATDASRHAPTKD